MNDKEWIFQISNKLYTESEFPHMYTDPEFMSNLLFCIIVKDLDYFTQGLYLHNYIDETLQLSLEFKDLEGDKEIEKAAEIANEHYRLIIASECRKLQTYLTYQYDIEELSKFMNTQHSQVEVSTLCRLTYKLTIR